MINSLSNVYIINMPKDTDRLKKVLLETRKVNITNPIIINGIDVNIGIPEHLQKYTNNIVNLFIAKGALGCGLAHINAWKTMIKNNDKYALFLEDDVTFVDDFNIKFNEIYKTVPKDFDMLYLSCFTGCDINKVSIPNKLLLTKKVTKINKNVYIPERPLAMHSYILSLNTAVFLVSYFEKNKLISHVDQQILDPMYDKKVYAIDPVLTMQNTQFSINSNNTTNKYPNIINGILDNYIDDYGFPFSYYLSISTYEISGVPINSYQLLFFIIGLLFSKNLKVLNTSFVVFNIIESQLWKQNKLLFIKTIMFNYLFVYIGYLIGNLIF